MLHKEVHSVRQRLLGIVLMYSYLNSYVVFVQGTHIVVQYVAIKRVQERKI